MSNDTAYRYLRTGRVPGWRTPGGEWRIDADALERVIRPAESEAADG